MNSGADGQMPRGFDAYEISLGDEMRGERATLGKSLLDVQRDLRIKATYVSAIENGDISVFETRGFIAGYVRSYARYLKMDPEACFLRFCEESGFEGVSAGVKSESASEKTAAFFQNSSRSGSLDTLANPRIPMTPPAVGMLSDFSFSALGSIAVLLLLLGGLGYGGWTVLQEVQRVQFVPVNQTPGVTSDVAVLSPDGAGENETVADLGVPTSFGASKLDQLYRPEELEVPEFIPRDAPIASIDAGSLGVYADHHAQVATIANTTATEAASPRVVAEGPPPVDIIALKPAWVRIYFEDGSVLFEKILDAGERYRLPRDVEGPQLRAGNAGAVFVMVGEKAYGPVGNPGGVVRDISLVQDKVTEELAVVTDFLSPLAPPLNLDELNRIENENAVAAATSN